MNTSRSSMVLLLLVVMIAAAIDGSIVNSNKQDEHDQQEQWSQEQGQQEQRCVVAPACCQTSPSIRSCPSCPEPRCPEPICPQPVCPAPVIPPPAKIPPCPNVSCPEPVCLQPVCPTPVCPPMPMIPPCPNVSCPQHMCPEPINPTCPPPPACATQPPPAEQKCNCPPFKLRTYDYRKGFGFYKAYKSKLTWREANATCSGDGGHLGIINSEQEAEIFRWLYKKEGLSGWVYIGFHDMYKEGDFRTVLGGALSDSGYTKWLPNEPNSHLGNNEDCGTIDARALFNDGGCEWKTFFICEVPESKVLGVM